jgi:hypothetical protein
VSLFIDLLVIGFLLILLIWGAYVGWWTGLVAFIALSLAILVSARIDEAVIHTIDSITAGAARIAWKLVVYVLLIAVFSRIGYLLIGLFLGFCRPRTHAAVRLFSSRVIGGFLGIINGFLFASVVFVSLFAGTGVAIEDSSTLYRVHTALVTGMMAPKIWSVVYVERNVYQFIFHAPLPPTLQVP